MDLELRVAGGLYVFDSPQGAIVPALGSLHLPGLGRCGTGLDETVLECRFPLRYTEPMEVTAEVQESPCWNPGARYLETKEMGGDRGLGLDFDPVALQLLFFHPGHVCPGAHVSFARERLVRNEQVLVAQTSVRLPLYVTHERGLGGRGSGGQ